MFKKLNAYLLARPKLLLALIWVFFLLAFLPGLYMTLMYPEMGFFKFWSYIIIQAVIALYLRILYSNIQNQRKEARKAERAVQREAANHARHGHKKKK